MSIELAEDDLPVDQGAVVIADGYAVMLVETLEDMETNLKFLKCLKENGLDTWFKYNRVVKAFKKQQYGEKHG